MTTQLTASPEFTTEECIDLFGGVEGRWYQLAARNQVESALLAGSKRICVVLATGAGKTTTSGLIFSSPKIRKYLGVKPGEKLKLLFVAHKHRLLTQAERTYADAENIELILQSAFSPIPENLDWHITCIDEFQHEAMHMIQLQLEKLGERPIIGLTATPTRGDNLLLKYDVEVNPISREQAVKEGWLAPTHIHSFIDVSSRDKTKVLTDMFLSYAHQMGNTFVFVRTKKEVAAITEVLIQQGHTAVGLLDQTNKELDVILDDFSKGKWKFIVNCGKLGEGIDVKGCTDVVLGQQLGSYIKLNQTIGRTTRPDSSSAVWELINPLSSYNLDSTIVVGTPESHRLVSKERGNWVERTFNYVTHRTNKQLGIVTGTRVVHR